jgi:hypothetical protein
MITIRTKYFKTWLSLSNYINNYFPSYNNYRFRGHSEASWRLESTLTRSLRNRDESDLSKVVEDHILGFKRTLRGRCRFDLEKIDQDELFAIGQHYGLYTPLLDFSSSPYVGLFFALAGESVTGKRCLWAVIEGLPNNIINIDLSYKSDLGFIMPLSNDNPRLVSQQGLFLKLPIGKSLEQVIESVDINAKGVLIQKMIFPDTLKQEILIALNIMNINYLTLFPDLYGSSLHTNYLLDINPFILMKRQEIWNRAKK